MQIQTIDPAKPFPVTIGEVVGNCFIKKVKAKVHKLRMFPAYGIQKDAFDKLPDYGVDTIVIYEDNKKVYRSPLEMWKLHGVVKDIGSGEQYFLSLKYMNMEDL